MINEKKMKIIFNYISMNDRNRKESVCFYYKNIDKDSCFLIFIRNGVERSGLYCLCLIVIDRINLDGMVVMFLMFNYLWLRRK